MFLLLFLSLFIFCDCCQYHSWNPKEIHIAALVLARGGSKGIPLKNLAKINGRSLLNITLTTLKEINFNSIWISTDSKEIYEKFKHFNVHWRSAETATDIAPSILGIQEFLYFHPTIDYVVLVQCTSPFLKAKYLEKALELLKSYECVFTVTRSFKLRWKKEENQLKPLNFDTKKRPRRQDWKGELVENGMFYIISRKLALKGYLQNERYNI